MPDWKAEIGKRLAALKLEPAREAEIAEELAQHLEDRFQELVSAGAGEDQAQRAALEELSEEDLMAKGLRGVEQEAPQKPIVLGSSGGHNLPSSLWHDIRSGLRQLRRNPGFTVVAVLTLALGIGANAAIFSMVNGILLSSLPYRQPSRLYSIHEVVPQWTHLAPELPVNSGNFLLWRKDCPAFSALAMIGPTSASLIGQGRPQFLQGAAVTSDFFSMLGIEPAFGRTLSTEKNGAAAASEIILSHRLWTQEFHSDPNVLGRIVNLDGKAMTVVGVLPASFRFPAHILASTPEYFRGFSQAAWRQRASVGGHNYFVIGRLERGARPREAKAQLDVVEARIARQSMGGKFNLYARLTPLKTEIVGSTRQALWMLATAAGLVLMIICANLANLLLARNNARVREVAVRSAFGASRGRLARQFLIESAILVFAGAGLGLVLGEVGLRLLVKNAPLSIPRVSEIQMDPRVLWFTLGVSVLAGLIFGLLPALRLANAQPVDAFKSSGPTVSASRGAARLRGALVVGEIALCAALLPGALLLLESLHHVMRANQWMNQENVLTAELFLPRYGKSEVHKLMSIQAKVEALPGVESAGYVSTLPLKGVSFGDSINFREIPIPGFKAPMGEFRFVSPGYFRTIGLPLVKGRFFSTEDTGKPVAIISESVARKFLSGRDPLGMHVRADFFGAPKWCRVIGVVGNVRDQSDAAPLRAVYFPIWEFMQTPMSLVVRTKMNPDSAAAAIRQAVWSVDPRLAVPHEQTLKTVMQSAEAPRRYETLLSGLFACFAVLLAAIGLYGVISYSVGQRTHEMGIRLALGADRGDVLRLVLRQGLVLALSGVAIGVAAALALTRLLSSLLFGVKPRDPLTFIAVAAILTAIALLACYLPARRAAKLDPIVALRYE